MQNYLRVLFYFIPFKQAYLHLPDRASLPCADGPMWTADVWTQYVLWCGPNGFGCRCNEFHCEPDKLPYKARTFRFNPVDAFRDGCCWLQFVIGQGRVGIGTAVLLHVPGRSLSFVDIYYYTKLIRSKHSNRSDEY